MMSNQALQQLMQSLQSPQSPDQQQQILQILKSNPQLMMAYIKQQQAQAHAQQGAAAGVAGASSQVLQHMLSQQQTPAQHQNPIQMQTMLGQGSGQGHPHISSPIQSQDGGEVPPMTSQDQLTEFGEQRHISGESSLEQWQQGYPGGDDQGLRRPGPQLMHLQQAQLGAGPMQGGTPTVRHGIAARYNSGSAMMHKQALQQLLQILRSPQSPDQQQQILQIFKSNPQLMATFIRHRQAQFQAQRDAATGVARQQLQHMFSQQQTPAHHQNRMQMQTMLGQGSGQGPPHTSPLSQSQDGGEVLLMTPQDQLAEFVERLYISGGNLEPTEEK